MDTISETINQDFYEDQAGPGGRLCLKKARVQTRLPAKIWSPLRQNIDIHRNINTHLNK